MSQIAAMPDGVVNRLSEHMGRKRINVSELSRMTGIAYPTILDLYHDRKKTIKFETVKRICDALGIPLSELFEYVPSGKNGD